MHDPDVVAAIDRQATDGAEEERVRHGGPERIDAERRGHRSCLGHHGTEQRHDEGSGSERSAHGAGSYAASGPGVNFEFEHPITPDQVREILRHAPGVKIVDDRTPA